MNKLITIPNRKGFARERELVLIPRKEYETLVRMRSRVVPEVKLTPVQKRAIRASERELKRGAYLTLGEVFHGMGGSHSKARA